jgi:membrane associated rhomboid family serine protease
MDKMADSDSTKNKGDGAGGDTLPDNIVMLPTREEREAARRAQEKAAHQAAADAAGPIINLPYLTKMLMGGLILIHIIITYALPEPAMEWVYLHLGFIPGRFTGTLDFDWFAPITPLTHMFIHASWVHLGINTAMLAALGSGVERWLGARRMGIFFILCGLCGALVHMALNFYSPYPVIGASGGLSGLFAAAMVMINRGNPEMGGRFGMLPLILIWIGITIGFGMMGSPEGHDIAWAAHVGGFLGGFIVLKAMKI